MPDEKSLPDCAALDADDWTVMEFNNGNFYDIVHEHKDGVDHLCEVTMDYTEERVNKHTSILRGSLRLLKTVEQYLVGNEEVGLRELRAAVTASRTPYVPEPQKPASPTRASTASASVKQFADEPQKTVVRHPMPRRLTQAERQRMMLDSFYAEVVRDALRMPPGENRDRMEKSADWLENVRDLLFPDPPDQEVA